MLSIPIVNTMSTRETRREYLEELKKAGAERVFLYVGREYVKEERCFRADMNLLAENICYYTDNGLQTGVWIDGFGHGGTLVHDVSSGKVATFGKICDLMTGGESEDSFCPLDDDFVMAYHDFVGQIIKAGAKMIMIDDDLRLSGRGAALIGCACEKHMLRFREMAQTEGCRRWDYTREELADIVFIGKENRERKIWMRLMGDTLREFASCLREAVDRIDDSVRLGHCSCLSTWDLDGVDSVELAKILAGKTRPFLRLIGAPYWNMAHAFRTSSLGTIIDLERMQFAWSEKELCDIEVFAEGDVYPRPRYQVPAAYLECLQQVLCAEGHGDDIMKYMLDYVQSPSYECGYVKRHLYYAPLRNAITDAFSGKKTAGVYVHEVMHTLEQADCRGKTAAELFAGFVPMSLNFTEACSLPISFVCNEYTKVVLVFGENARFLDDKLLRMPMILDAKAAEILQECGVDVGLKKSESVNTPQKEYYSDAKEWLPVETEGAFRRFQTDDAAKIHSVFDNGMTAAYTYENADGGRYLVYAFEADTIQQVSALWKSYLRQEQLFQATEWLAAGSVPLAIRKEPGLYVLCRKSVDKMAVGIWNFGQDIGMPDEMICDEEYDAVEGIDNTKVVLKGKKVQLQSVIAPGTFAGFVMIK